MAANNNSAGGPLGISNGSGVLGIGPANGTSVNLNQLASAANTHQGYYNGGGVLNAWGGSGQVVMLPEGPVSVDEFIKLREEMREWKAIKGILEAHQIIDDWPDGDILIRIKRKQLASPTNLKDVAQNAIVDFGVEDEKVEKK